MLISSPHRPAPASRSRSVGVRFICLNMALSVSVALACIPASARATTTWSAAVGPGGVQLEGAGVAALRGAVELGAGSSLGLAVQGGLIDRDAQESFAMVVNIAASYRQPFTAQLAPGLVPFWGGLVGVGVWTACVSAERCGGFGPSIGGEIGLNYAISPQMQLFSAIRADAQTGLFGPQATVLLSAWTVGITL